MEFSIVCGHCGPSAICDVWFIVLLSCVPAILFVVIFVVAIVVVVCA